MEGSATRPGGRRAVAAVLRGVVVATALTALVPVAGCGDGDAARRVDLERRDVEPAPSAEAPSRTPSLRVALGGIITPHAGIAYYLDFLAFLERRLGIPVRAVEKDDYAEINHLLREGSIDFAFVCSGPYVDGHDDFGLKLLAAPQAYGKTVYYSYIIVPAGSPSRSLDDLRGRSFAFTDRLSNTGCLVPTYMLARRGETPTGFFAETTYTRAHDTSIRAIAEGLVDGAAVDSLIWEYMAAVEPETIARTRIIERSPPFAIPPVAVRPGLDPALERRVKEIFLGAHEDPEGRAILAKMRIDRFTEIDDEAFASIREMKAWIETRGAPK